MNDSKMNYPQPGKCATVRVRGVRDQEGKALYIRTNRIMKDAIARDVRGDGAEALSRMDLAAAMPVDIS